MKFSAAALLSLAVSTVYAQVQNAGVAVNLPTLGQVLNAGTSFTITWTVATTGTPSSSINSIALMKGGSANLETVTPNILSAAIPVNPPSYTWNIPSNIETNPSYVLALAGNNGATTYSTYFTIMGAAAGSTNSSSSAATTSGNVSAASASNGAPASSGASKASGSASAASPSSTSAASNLKAGLAGVAGVAGAVALLL